VDDLLNRPEAAVLLGVTPGTVGMRLHRGRQGWIHPFPEPVGKDGRWYLWRAEDVEVWAFLTGRLPLAALDLGDLIGV
jgi:hypothetical protein